MQSSSVSFPSLLLCLLGLLQIASGMPTIEAVGSKFFTSDGNQFFVKGIAYQLSPDDPLVDTAQCQLDANLMKTVGANAIRVYHVDPTKNHDGCMTAFSNAGIYLFLDLDTFSTQIDPKKPTFNDAQFAAFAKVLDNFQQYENLAGVFVGNEVLTQPADSPAAPFVKAAAAQIKAYRDKQNYRKIPVGYSAADIASLRPNLQDYLVCGGDDSKVIDFFGLNAYEWCGVATTYETSGYINLQAMAVGFPKPIFFSETGCITARPRNWADMGAIFGVNMSDTWSGAIAYEWIQEENDYGLIRYGDQGIPRSGTPTPISPDFPALQTAWANVKPSSIAMKQYAQQIKAISTPACPAFTAGEWEVNGNPPLPSGNQEYLPGSVPTAVVTTGSGLGISATYASAATTSSSGKNAATTQRVSSTGASSGPSNANVDSSSPSPTSSNLAGRVVTVPLQSEFSIIALTAVFGMLDLIFDLMAI